MTRVQVRDTGYNVFAYHDCETTEEAIAFASGFVADGFRVEVIPVVDDEDDLYTRPIEEVLGFEA